MLAVIVEFFESIGRARAASALANAGYYDIAKSMMIRQTLSLRCIHNVASFRRRMGSLV
jgi:hypothetical protein